MLVFAGNFKTIAKLFDFTIVIREYISEERSQYKLFSAPLPFYILFATTERFLY